VGVPGERIGSAFADRPWHCVAATGMFVLLLAAISAGISLRFENLTTNGIRGNDTIYYTNLARAWSEGEFAMQIADGILAYRPVVYALYAAGIKILGFQDWTLKVVNATLDSLNIGLVFLLCYLLGRRDVLLSLIGAASYALLPGAILLAREELVHVSSTFMVLSCTILFVIAINSSTTTRRCVLLVLSGIVCGLAALTHEELVLCSAGFTVVIFWDNLSRHGHKGLWGGTRECVLFGTPVAAVALKLYFVNQGLVSDLSASAVELSTAERSIAYLARLFRFSWNGVVGMSSVVVAYACFALMLALVASRVSRRRWHRTCFGWAKPIDYLPWAVVISYLVSYALLFSTALFERTFLPMFALLGVGLTVWCGQLAGRWLARRTAHAVILGAATLILPFNLDQFASFFTEGSKQWYAGPIPTNFSPQRGVRRLREWSARTHWPRQVHDALGEHVNERARLLVASSLMTPYPGRRVLQLRYYFGDDAIYAIDHTEPLEELLERYHIKFVVVSKFRADQRVPQMKEYRAYRYGGRWSEPTPLRLGASYGFAPGEYTWQREALFIHEFLTARGARLLTDGTGARLYLL